MASEIGIGAAQHRRIHCCSPGNNEAGNCRRASAQPASGVGRLDDTGKIPDLAQKAGGEAFAPRAAAKDHDIALAAAGTLDVESQSKVAALQAVARAAVRTRDEAAQRLAAILRESRPRDRPAFAERPYPSF